jgi:hypothetical protein
MLVHDRGYLIAAGPAGTFAFFRPDGTGNPIAEPDRGAGLPFQVPGPVVTVAGEFVAETAAGPATPCRWIPGIRPDLTREPALRRSGRPGQVMRRGDEAG